MHYIKQNIICLLLIAVFAVGTAAGVTGISASADVFDDVSIGYQYSEAIEVLNALGIFEGMDDGSFP